MIRDKHPQAMKVELLTTCARILSTYREKCSENSPIGQLILPESLKLLPLICACITKCEALTGGAEITVDDRAWQMGLVSSMTVAEAILALYPTVLPLTSLALETPDQQLDMPKPIRASLEFFKQNEAYAITNGQLRFIWIGAQVPAEWLQDIFDVPALNRLDTEKV